MKVQIITNLFPLPWQPNRAAFNRQQFEYLSQCSELSILVLVAWLLSFDKQRQLKPSTFNGARLEYHRYFYIPGILRFTYPFTMFIGLLFKIPGLLRFRPDCLLLSWAYPDAVAGVAIGRLLNIPTIIKVHGSDINMHAQYPARARQIKWAIRHSKAVITVSKDLADKLLDLDIPEEKIKVIYNGLNHEIFQPTDKILERAQLELASERKIILFIGNLKHAKGCVDLLEAWINLLEGIENSPDLYFIGSGPAEKQMKELIEQAGLECKARLLGVMDHKCIAKWINACDVVALPSHNEGVPNVLLESMACGVPVVATRVGGIPEVVNTDTGILVEPLNSDRLQKALLEALEKDWDRELIAKSVAGFNWGKSAGEVRDLVASVIENGS